MKFKMFNREWVNRLFLIGLGICLLVGLEFGLRLLDFGKEYDFVLEDETAHRGRACLNTQYIALHYFQHLPVNLDGLMKEHPWFSDTEFPIEKQPGAFRVFLVGASTTRGFPFEGRSINYSRFLEMVLKDVLPSRKIEVLNAGYDALSSFGVLDLTQKILEFSPDLVVVYTGHNEFIGHFGVNSNVNFGNQRWVADMVTGLHNSRLFLTGELVALKLRSRWKEEASHEGRVNLFRAMLSEEHLSWGEDSHRIALAHYRQNLLQLVSDAKERGARVLIVNPASNLRDFSPVLSLPDPRLTVSQVSNIEAWMAEGRVFLEQNRNDEARKLFLKVLQADSTHAHAHFYLARTYEALRDVHRARQEYRLAREFDKVHLRTCSAMQEVVRKVGQQTGAAVLELEQVMEKVSPNGLVGSNFFLEHVHPNVNGHFVIASSLARKIAEAGLPGDSASWDWSRLKMPRHYIANAGYDARQFLNARYTIGRLLLDFPFFQCEEGEKVLAGIDHQEREQELIRSCRKNRKESQLAATRS